MPPALRAAAMSALARATSWGVAPANGFWALAVGSFPELLMPSSARRMMFAQSVYSRRSVGIWASAWRYSFCV